MKAIYPLLFAVFLIPLFYSSLMEASDEKASAMDELFRDYARPGVPGASVIVIHDGKVLFKKAYGLANVEANIAATANTNYRLASVSKQFTAMAIMILAERKKLSYTTVSLVSFPAFRNTANRLPSVTCSITAPA